MANTITSYITFGSNNKFVMKENSNTGTGHQCLPAATSYPTPWAAEKGKMNVYSNDNFYYGNSPRNVPQDFLNTPNIIPAINRSSDGSALENSDFKMFSVNNLESFNTEAKLNEWYNANHESNATGAL
ncbi:hypothetical protein FACS189496_5200 [Bacilli bacterium]|nr:hypothetical protein FACS189496_5200 [Bacilli bacterium]